VSRRRKADTMEAADYPNVATEDEWQATVVDLARACGWLCIHIRTMTDMEAGIPDLLLFRGDRFVLAELKTATGTVSIKQQMWHARAADRGVVVHVWRPADYEVAERILR
jgi:hypothetical protein